MDVVCFISIDAVVELCGRLTELPAITGMGLSCDTMMGQARMSLWNMDAFACASWLTGIGLTKSCGMW